MATAWFWSLTGRQGDAVSLAARVVDLPPGPAPDHARAALRLFSLIGGDGLPKKDVVIRVREELTVTDAMSHHPMLAMVEPMLAIFSGDLPAAQAAAERARAHPDAWARAAAQLGRAFMAENEGDAQGAERDAIGALEAFRALGDRWGQAMALGQVAERRTLRADHAGAIAGYEESLELVSQLGAIDDLPELIGRLATQRARAGDLDGAERELRKGFAAARERAANHMEAYLLCALSNVERQRGDLAAATEHLDRAAAMLSGVARSEGHWRAFYESARAALAISAGDGAAARAALRDGFETMLELRDLPVLAMLGERAAHLVTAEGNPAGAARLIGIGTALRGTPDLGNFELNELINRLRATLGEVAYTDACLAGAGLSHEEALAELAAVLGSIMDGGPPSR